MEKTKFSSKFTFVLAAVGSAVGMGNIWMFPYRVGQYGGAAFLLPYFLFVALFAYVGLSSEFAFGRLTSTGPVGSFDFAFKEKGKKHGAIVGCIPMVGTVGIAIGYAVIVGWVFRYLLGSIDGSMFLVESDIFFSQISNSFGSIPFHLIAIVATMLIIGSGVLKGIEKISKFMMPTFFILFLIIAIRVAFLPGAIEGYKYLFIPKWEFLLNPMTWIMAMGQAFFSLSIAASGMIIYGSYLSKKEDVVKLSIVTAILDTSAALLASFVIIPAIFAFGMDPTAGPSLMFITMPKVFAQMPMGELFAIVFFTSVLFAGITSLVNMLEVASEACITQLNISRKKAVIIIGILTFGVGIFIENVDVLGLWMDLVTIYIVPFGALLGAVVIFYILPKNKLMCEINLNAAKTKGNLYYNTGKYIYVAITLIVLILGIILGGIG